uniref:Uncharacterized protein n=1 Tax=Setaria italica TaxID=4555 RepID=K4AJP6_SETIT
MSSVRLGSNTRCRSGAVSPLRTLPLSPPLAAPLWDPPSAARPSSPGSAACAPGRPCLVRQLACPAVLASPVRRGEEGVEMGQPCGALPRQVQEGPTLGVADLLKYKTLINQALKVALLCVLNNPKSRPPMRVVVKMLLEAKEENKLMLKLAPPNI